MTNGMNGIILQLEQQRAAIERALTALRAVEGSEAPATAYSRGQKGGAAVAGQNRRSEGQKRRWATKFVAKGAAVTTSKPGRKGGVTPEGRKRLAEAMKRRWAAKRAATAVKKTARKKSAA